MANYLDRMGDMIRGLMRSGMSEDAAVAALRAAQNAPPAPVRQMELPMPSDMGVERTPDFLARMRATHLADDTYGPSSRQAVNYSPDIAPLASTAGPDMPLGSDLWHQMDKSARGYENIVKGRTGNLRNQNPQLTKIAQQNIQAANARSAQSQAQMLASEKMLRDYAVGGAALAGAGALGAGASALYQPGKNGTLPADAAESTTADLAAESRPAPAVAATDEDGIPTDEAAFTEMFKRQYQEREDKRQAKGKGGYADPSDKAKAILDDLNARRRTAGREVPEAAKMEAEANSFLALSNSQRNAPGYKPRNASDPREQAQILLQKLNADRMEAGGEVPHSQQVLAEVRRLQAMGDQQRFPSR